MRVDAAAWRSSRMYLLGIDLYNLGYFWESHEAFEALWHAAGSASLEKQFFQAIIQIAASNLKFFMGADGAGRALAERALAKLSDVPAEFMGLDVDALRREVAARIAGERLTPPLLRLCESTG
jgi:predicted metal-dependent hydrolase